MKTALQCLILLAGLGSLAPACAEKADKDKPVHLEADRIAIDDAKKIHILEGNVQLTRGTLVIRTEKLVVTQDANGFQKGVAYGGAGGLAHFRQKREGKDEYIDGEAERIEHDGNLEKTDLFNRAFVKSGMDEVRGQYISYDGRSENYVVTSGANGTSAAAAGKPDRVRAVIQPKKDGKPVPPVSAAGAPLQEAPAIATPRQE